MKKRGKNHVSKEIVSNVACHELLCCVKKKRTTPSQISTDRKDQNTLAFFCACNNCSGTSCLNFHASEISCLRKLQMTHQYKGVDQTIPAGAKFVGGGQEWLKN
jgi:hypothetical protein